MANEHRITVGNLAVFKEEADKEYISGKSTQSLTPTQQVNAQNNMMGKAYAPAQHSGLGKVYLNKNNGALTQSMFAATDTVYVLQYAYTLSENITIPARCTLAFEGGSIKGNGTDKNTITGNTTKLLISEHIFDGIIIKGTWDCPNIPSSIFVNEEDVDVALQLVALSSDTIFNTITLSTGKTFQVNVNGKAFQSGLWLKSNTKLNVCGTLKTVPNNLAYCNTIICYCKENIEICGGGIIMGDKDQHTGTDGEYGRGVLVGSSKNVYIHDVTITNCYGDGISVTSITYSTGPSSYCSVKNCHIYNILRNGIGIGYANNVDVANCVITDVYGKNPQAAIDIEADGNNEYAKNITITNVTSYDCLHGLYILNMHTDGVIDNIKVSGCAFTCDNIRALYVSNNVTNLYISDTLFQSEQYATCATFNVTGDMAFVNCTFKGASEATGNLLENFVSNYYLRFYNCTFDAPSANALQYVSNVTMSQCSIKCTLLSGNFIRNTVIDSSILTGVALNSQRQDSLRVTRCKIYVASQSYFEDCKDITISNNTIIVTADATINFIYANRCQFFTLANNIIRNNNDISIKIILQNCNYCLLETNPIVSSDGTTVSEIAINNIGSTFNVRDGYALDAGTTRPTGVAEGTMFFDKTLNKPLWYKGNGEWVDSTGSVIS